MSPEPLRPDERQNDTTRTPALIFGLGAAAGAAGGLIGLGGASPGSWLLFKGRIELVFASPQIVAFTLATTGLLLWLTDRLGPRPVGLKRIGFRIAIIMRR